MAISQRLRIIRSENHPGESGDANSATTGTLSGRNLAEVTDLLREVFAASRSYIPECRQLALVDLDDKHVFDPPLQVLVESLDNEVLVRSIDLNLYGSGDTEFDAMQMFKREVISLYEDLINEEDNNLAGPALVCKQFLRRNTKVR